MQCLKGRHLAEMTKSLFYRILERNRLLGVDKHSGLHLRELILALLHLIVVELPQALQTD